MGRIDLYVHFYAWTLSYIYIGVCKSHKGKYQVGIFLYFADYTKTHSNNKQFQIRVIHKLCLFPNMTRFAISFILSVAAFVNNYFDGSLIIRRHVSKWPMRFLETPWSYPS